MTKDTFPPKGNRGRLFPNERAAKIFRGQMNHHLGARVGFDHTRNKWFVLWIECKVDAFEDLSL